MSETQEDSPKAKGRLTEGSIAGHLTRMAIPMSWGLFAVIGINRVDTFFVGQLGTRELAALSFTFPVVFFMLSLAIGLGVGASSVLARAIGGGNRERVQRMTTAALLLALLIVALWPLVLATRCGRTSSAALLGAALLGATLFGATLPGAALP